MENTARLSEMTSASIIMDEEDVATKILRALVKYLSWSPQDNGPQPLNLTAVLEMLGQLTDTQREMLFNVTKTTSEHELIHVLNVTVMQPRPFEVSLMEFQAYRVQKILLLYMPPILILLGTFGNLFSFIVLRRKPMLKVSSYLYLAVLAIIDTLVLYNGLLRIWIVELLSFDYQGAGNWICKLTVAFGYVSSDLSVWLIIAVTVERYIVVCFPFQASSMCNVSRARKVIVGLFLLMLSLNVHFMWTAEIVEEQGENICRGGENFRQLVEEIWPWVDTLIYSFLPFLTITILNVLIIREVAGAHSNRIRLSASECESTNMASGNTNTSSSSCSRRVHSCEGTRLTALLLTVSFTFLLLTMPNNIALIVSRFWNQKYAKKEDLLSFEERRVAMHGMAQFKLVMTITELLMYTNHSINFFLYCATGNKFRQQISDLMRCGRFNRQPQTYAERTMTSYSMRKTSQSVLALGFSELALSRRATRRNSSCLSSEEVDKNVDNKFSLEEQPRVCLNVNGSIAAANISAGRVEAVKTENTSNALNGHTILNEGENCEHPTSKELFLEDFQVQNNVSKKTSDGCARNDCPSLSVDTSDLCQNSIFDFGALYKIYQGKRKHKHLSVSKQDRVGSGCDVNSRDNEYFLMRPTGHWCDTLAPS